MPLSNNMYKVLSNIEVITTENNNNPFKIEETSKEGEVNPVSSPSPHFAQPSQVEEVVPQHSAAWYRTIILVIFEEEPNEDYEETMIWTKLRVILSRE
jgi:hypothetical protein